MLNYIAIQIVGVRDRRPAPRARGVVRAVAGRRQRGAARDHRGRHWPRGHLGVIIAAPRRADHLVAAVPEHDRVRDPDRRREPGRRAIRRHEAAPLIGAGPRVGGAARRPGGRHRDPGRRRRTCRRRTRRTSASTRSPSRCSGGPTRSASCSAACCSGPCAPARRPMQSEAGIPVQMIDLLQGVILFFLAADVVVRRVFRIQARRRRRGRARRRSPAPTAARRRRRSDGRPLRRPGPGAAYPAARLPRRCR